MTAREQANHRYGKSGPHCDCPECQQDVDRLRQSYLPAVERFVPGTTIRVTDPATGGQKDKKPEAYHLIPVEPLAEVARVYGFGASKYADRNWEKGYKWGLSYAALQRHINAFWKRETTDPESGLNHLAHAVFHCLALMEWVRTHPELDDRPPARVA